MHLFKKSEGDECIFKSLNVKVSGMHCEGCNSNLQKSLAKIDGIQNISPDFKKEEVSLQFDENKVNLEKIRGAIRRLGFIPGVEQIGR
jgi:copper chaperone CopZ